MAAYILVMPWELDATRPAEEMEPYFEHVEETMAPYGGRYLRLRLDPIELLEGDWQPPLGFAMVEFPSMEQARGWYRAPKYAPLRALRIDGGRFSLILADGMPEGETLRAVMQADRELEPEGGR
jgi:uncharacterized protein (DUF1330 family)